MPRSGLWLGKDTTLMRSETHLSLSLPNPKIPQIWACRKYPPIRFRSTLPSLLRMMKRFPPKDNLCSSLFSFSSVQFSHSVMSDSLQPHELQHARPPCPSPTPRVHSSSHPSSWWCHPAISSTWGVALTVSYHFAFSYCSWGSQGKNTEVICYSLLRWTTFYQISPPCLHVLGGPTRHGLVSLS